MTDFILHRANNLSQSSLAYGFIGAEIDLRLYFGKVVLAHDPFTKGVPFKDWLSCFAGNILVLNVKETGIEEKVIEIINLIAPKIEYFFLDVPIPSLVKLANNRAPLAVRVSELEPLAFSLKISSNWIWLDSFSGDWTHLEEIRALRSTIPQGICLVSPELQNRWPNNHGEEFNLLKKCLRDNPSLIQAICTKDRSFWID